MKMRVSVSNQSLKKITKQMERMGARYRFMYKGTPYKIINAYQDGEFRTKLELESTVGYFSL